MGCQLLIFSLIMLKTKKKLKKLQANELGKADFLVG